MNNLSDCGVKNIKQMATNRWQPTDATNKNLELNNSLHHYPQCWVYLWALLVNIIMSIVLYDSTRCSCCGVSNVILKKCGGCRLAFYCGVNCQTHHWRSKHKFECNGMNTNGVLQNDMTYEIGRMPRCILDGYITIRDEDLGDAYAVAKVTDFHVWCVDEYNNIYDYPIEQIESIHWTDKVIRRPFDVAHAMETYQFMMDFRKNLPLYQASIAPLTQTQKISMIENDTFPLKQCLDRALALRESNPRKFAVVIGSLGFIQPDGSIFWEYG